MGGNPKEQHHLNAQGKSQESKRDQEGRSRMQGEDQKRQCGGRERKGVVSGRALPLTLPVASDNYPGREVIGQQTSWLFLWKLLRHKLPLHLKGTGTSLAEGPAESP